MFACEVCRQGEWWSKERTLFKAIWRVLMGECWPDGFDGAGFIASHLSSFHTCLSCSLSHSLQSGFRSWCQRIPIDSEKGFREPWPSSFFLPPFFPEFLHLYFSLKLHHIVFPRNPYHVPTMWGRSWMIVTLGHDLSVCPLVECSYVQSAVWAPSVGHGVGVHQYSGRSTCITGMQWSASEAI